MIELSLIVSYFITSHLHYLASKYLLKEERMKYRERFAGLALDYVVLGIGMALIAALYFTLLLAWVGGFLLLLGDMQKDPIWVCFGVGGVYVLIYFILKGVLAQKYNGVTQYWTFILFSIFAFLLAAFAGNYFFMPLFEKIGF